MSYNSAITYLVNNTSESIFDFKKSLKLLSENYLEQYNSVDLIIFHERGFDLNIIPPNLRHISVEIEFKYDQYSQQKLDKILDFFPHPTHGNGPIDYGHPGFSRGYRHMCQFFFSEYFFHPIFDKYNYIMRLDTDSFILAPVENDLFCQLEKSDAVYGYIREAVQIDSPLVVENLWEFVSKKYSINSEIGTMFYTNFEIVNLEFFRSQEAEKFYNYINSSAGIHIHRWGDAPLRYLMLESLNYLNRAVAITGILYQHGAIYETRRKVRRVKKKKEIKKFKLNLKYFIKYFINRMSKMI